MEISLERLSPDSVQYLIKISGEFHEGDGDKFRKKTYWIREACVIITSQGGDLEAGLDIGRQIRDREFATEVREGQLCASAAALAWLGGVPRKMSMRSGIGFHGAYVEIDGIQQVDSAANALIGGYLSNLGLKDNAIRFITEAPPHGLAFLSASEALCYDIDVVLLDGSLPPSEELPERQMPIEFVWALKAADFYYKHNQYGQTGAYSHVLEQYEKAFSKNQPIRVLYACVIDWIACDMDYWWGQNYGMPHLEYNQEEQVQARAHEALIKLGHADEDERNGIIMFWRMLANYAQNKHANAIREKETAAGAESS